MGLILRFPLSLSLRRCLPLALALTSASILPMAAKAVPLQSLPSTTTTTNGSSTGPRRPGSLAAPALGSADNTVDLSQQRGRAVPGLRDTTPRKTLAEGTGSSDSLRIQ